MDDLIFDEAGKKFGIKGGTANDYYQYARELGAPSMSGRQRKKMTEQESQPR